MNPFLIGGTNPFQGGWGGGASSPIMQWLQSIMSGQGGGGSAYGGASDMGGSLGSMGSPFGNPMPVSGMPMGMPQGGQGSPNGLAGIFANVFGGGGMAGGMMGSMNGAGASGVSAPPMHPALLYGPGTSMGNGGSSAGFGGIMK